MIRKVLNARGFSMLQGIFVAGGLAAAALVGTKVLSNQKALQTAVQARDSIEQLHTLIFTTLQNRNHCSATYFANGLKSVQPEGEYELHTIHVQDTVEAFTEPVQGPVENSRSDDHGRPVILRVFDERPGNLYVNGTIAIKSLRLQVPSNLGTPGLLKITYSKRSNPQTEWKELQKSISIKFNDSPSHVGKILSCNAYAGKADEDLLKSACESIPLFSWNEVTESCLLKDLSCSTGTLLTGVSASGVPDCKKFHEAIDIGTLVDLSPVSGCANARVVRFLRVGNKVTLYCGAAEP
jgi:hypothetical protein